MLTGAEPRSDQTPPILRWRMTVLVVLAGVTLPETVELWLTTRSVGDAVAEMVGSVGVDRGWAEAEAPTLAVARGAARLLDDPALLARLASAL